MYSVNAMVRAGGAMLVALGATVVAASVAIVTSILYALCLNPLSGHRIPNPFVRIPKWWSAFLVRVCYRRILGVRIVVYGTVAPAREGETILVVGNHPSSLGLPLIGWAVTHYLASHMVAIGKRQQAWNPFIGWPLIVLRSVILVDQSNREAARASIRIGLRTLAHTARVLLILPDTHRPTRERIASDRQRFMDRIPGIGTWLRYTLVPRTGGLSEILVGVDRAMRVVHMTSAFDVEEGSIFDAARIVGRTYSIDLEEHHGEPLPRVPTVLEMTLNDLWERKNIRIAEWRGETLR